MAVTLTNTPARIFSASATSHVISLGFTPTAGRTLVVAWYVAGGTATFTSIDPDWTLIHDNTNAGRVHSCGWAYRISDGTETTFSVSVSSSQSLVAVFLELDGLEGSAVLDQSAESTANQNSTNATSASTGTTATLSVSDGYALSFFSSDGQTGWDTGRSYTNGSTELFADMSVGGTSTPGCVFAYKELSSTTGFSETISTTDVGDGMYGSVAVFKQASGGGTVGNAPGAAWSIDVVFTGGAATGAANAPAGTFAVDVEFTGGAANGGIVGNAPAAAWEIDVAFTGGVASSAGTGNAPGANWDAEVSFTGGAATGLIVGNAPGATWNVDLAFTGGTATGGGPVNAPGANFAVNFAFTGGNAYIPGTTVVPTVVIYITGGVALQFPAA